MAGSAFASLDSGHAARHALRRNTLRAISIALVFSAVAAPQTKQDRKLSRPRALDQGISWQRDPATGELRAVSPIPGDQVPGGGQLIAPAPIQIVTQMVSVTCSVSTLEGEA